MAEVTFDKPAGAFIPFGLTVDGEVGPSAATFMNELARRIARADNRGLTRSAARDHVRARIGNALALGVTKQIMAFLKDATTTMADSNMTTTRVASYERCLRTAGRPKR